MRERVFLLGELMILGLADFAALYRANNGDVGEVLTHLPRAGAAAAVVWAVLYFVADAGAGGVAAAFGLLIDLGFLAAVGTGEFTWLNDYLGVKTVPPQTAKKGV